ncbi:hypothetical protein EXN66_Car014285 [Channa argus]|uniref:Uncharacterized protein n=1 Tax=Channa argus TaxID=215402 RepID=A0A6G1Q8J6_CHAAH|nr:hypothetical protein EXN66_Car014285 [Channa argus]KAK2896055.1 hypothetical protein Q8A73_015543 [Channa argus]
MEAMLMIILPLRFSPAQSSYTHSDAVLYKHWSCFRVENWFLQSPRLLLKFSEGPSMVFRAMDGRQIPKHVRRYAEAIYHRPASYPEEEVGSLGCCLHKACQQNENLQKKVSSLVQEIKTVKNEKAMAYYEVNREKDNVRILKVILEAKDRQFNAERQKLNESIKLSESKVADLAHHLQLEKEKSKVTSLQMENNFDIMKKYREEIKELVEERNKLVEENKNLVDDRHNLQVEITELAEDKKKYDEYITELEALCMKMHRRRKGFRFHRHNKVVTVVTVLEKRRGKREKKGKKLQKKPDGGAEEDGKGGEDGCWRPMHAKHKCDDNSEVEEDDAGQK